MGVQAPELKLLIEKVTAEIISKVGLETIERVVQDTKLCQNRENVLVLVTDFTANLDSLLAHLQGSFQGSLKDCKLSLGTYSSLEGIKRCRFNDMFKTIFDLNDQSMQQELIGNLHIYDRLFVISPKLTQLKSIVQLEDCGFIESSVIYFVLHGKPTAILVDYDIFKLPSNSFSATIKELFSDIKSMGISVDVLGQKDGLGKKL